MKLVTQKQFDAALVVVLGEDLARVIPNRVNRQNAAIHAIFMEEMEAGPLAEHVAIIRTGARTLQELGHYRWAPDQPAGREALAQEEGE